MEFKFYIPGESESDEPDEITATGWAVKDAGKAEDQIGFHVMGDEVDGLYATFTIPELRQMLAEAEELRDRQDRKSCAGCSCSSCICSDLAPLASPDEMDEEFEDRVLEEPVTTPSQFLDRAETSLNNGYVQEAEMWVKLAYAARGLR